MAKKIEQAEAVVATVASGTATHLNDGTNKLKGIKNWFTTNSKKIVLYGGIIVAALLAYIAYKKFYKEPLENKANENLAVAQYYFANDSLNLALNGDGKNIGFAGIIKKNSGTNAANLSNFYAAICQMKLAKDSTTSKSNFEAAIKYLKSFEPSGATQFAGSKYQLLGDCYSSIGNNADAIKNYEECGAIGDAVISSQGFYKAALLSEVIGDSKKAGEFYKELYTRFPASNKAADAVKGAARNGILLDK
jgi:predicted negative regulator of RcsB-dependent stress response